MSQRSRQKAMIYHALKRSALNKLLIKYRAQMEVSRQSPQLLIASYNSQAVSI